MLDYINTLAKQSTRFVMAHRPYITLGAIAFFMLPLFNFAAMGALAYIAYPLLVLATFQVLYYSESSGILGHGLKAQDQTAQAKNFNWLLSLEKIRKDEKMYEEIQYNPVHVDETTSALLPVADQAIGNVSDHGDDEEVVAEEGNKVSAWFRSLSQYSFVHLAYDWINVKAKWDFVTDEDYTREDTWKAIVGDVAKTAAIYTSVYFTAVALAPIVISPLHTLLGFAGPIGLVGSYFITLGVYYAGALTLKQMKETDSAKSEPVLNTTMLISGTGAIALAVCATLFTNTSILAAVMSIPTVLGVVAPVALLLVAGLVSTYSTATDKLGNLNFTWCKPADALSVATSANTSPRDSRSNSVAEEDSNELDANDAPPNHA